MVSGLHALALLFIFFALITLRKRNPLTATILAFSGVILQGIGFALGTWQFYKVWADLEKASPADNAVAFGAGMYTSGGTFIVLLLSSFLAWSAIRVRPFEKLSTWSV